MEFLPIIKEDRNVYAGFWKRLGAGFIDFIVIISLVYGLALILGDSSKIIIITSCVVSSFAYAVYLVCFHYYFGATIGKMVVGVKVTNPDGSRIGLKQALLRSSIDLCFAVLFVAADMSALSQVGASEYLVANANLQKYYPSWFSNVELAMYIWSFGEFITLLFNRRKRAIHDFIAGTVVINKGLFSTR